MAGWTVESALKDVESLGLGIPTSHQAIAQDDPCDLCTASTSGAEMLPAATQSRT